MDVMEAIKTRRSIGKVSERPVEKDLLMTILDTARYAPNHYRTDPWLFTVLTGAGRDKLGDVYGRINMEALEENASENERKEAYEKGIKKARRAPVIVVVTVEPNDMAKVVFVEEIAATACAVQNVLLAAHNLGLAAIWRSGAASYHPIMNQAFGVSEHGVVLGYVYLGYPLKENNAVKPRELKPLEDRVTWIK
ncbi:nitroreductase [Camelliibacillus cellulosilyticus]|uniref:Putative NAD(P)H nitroreductase n=1 Tax=Camelliibacillus cellulosilyticus TaxID=2174486 RepID=A0ABV9GKF4_9BACL